VVVTLSRRQLRRREAWWGGSPRRNPAPRYTNRIRGGTVRVSRQGTAKPDATEGPSRICGGRRGRVVVLIRGGLLQVGVGMARPTAGAVTRGLMRQESAEALVPAGRAVAGKGPNVNRERRRASGLDHADCGHPVSYTGLAACVTR